MSDFELTARILPEPLPSVSEPPRFLSVTAHLPNGTFITDIQNRSGVSFSEPLNTPGTGQLTMARSDPLLQSDAYPNLLAFGNIIKFWLGDKCVSGMRIKQKTSGFVTTEEGINLTIQVSGPTVHHMLSDPIVKHDGVPRPNSGTSRSYSWASRRGEWWHLSQWNHTIQSWSRRNPPTAAKRHNPKHWRVPSARWIGFRAKWKYLRRNFSIAEAGNYRFFASADENFKLYLNGEEILSDEHREIGYRSYVQCDQHLQPGVYTIAVQTEAFPSPHGDGWDLFIFGLCRINKRGRRILPPILVSDSRWEAHKGNPPPGWNRAQVLRSMINEAKARGGTAADYLTLGFGPTTDSSGKTWVDQWNEDIDVGSTILDAQAVLSENGNFDVWVDPEDLTAKAWSFRGVDRSASIALLPGVNLLDYEVTETDEVINQALVQYDGGWFNAQLDSSIAKYQKRETYAELGDIKDEATARLVMNQALKGIGRTNKESGTPDVKVSPEDEPSGSIVPVEGMFPMVDFETGDIISALNSNVDIVPHRLMSLTCTEDDNGALSFDSEQEEVDRIL